MSEPGDTTFRYCNFCEYPTDCTYYRRGMLKPGAEPGFWLCFICANTKGGNAAEYPDQYDNIHLMEQAAWNTNYLAGIATGKPFTEPPEEEEEEE